MNATSGGGRLKVVTKYYTLDYDAENRLKSVAQGGQTTTFTYDGDGRRVMRDTVTDTVVYVGSHYEVRFEKQDMAEDLDGDCLVTVVDIMQVVARWVFRGTMEGSRDIMVRYGDSGKKLWPTEFGWASVDGLGVSPAPGYEYASDNTAEEQAQYIVRAYEMGRSWGWVGAMFLWNLNFGPVSGASDEKAAFGIVHPDWSPRLALAAINDMPK